MFPDMCMGKSMGEVNIETERKPKTRTTEITADEFYVAVLSNEAKVVLAKFKA